MEILNKKKFRAGKTRSRPKKKPSQFQSNRNGALAQNLSRIEKNPALKKFYLETLKGIEPNNRPRETMQIAIELTKKHAEQNNIKW